MSWRTPKGFDLDRFVLAQNSGDIYLHALAELQAGRKTSHWMWFVFPQLAGLGTSSMSRRYSIASLDEARAYLAHPVLGSRLIECATIVAATANPSAADLLGGIDAQKLHSCVTLFLRAAPSESSFSQVLARYFDAEPDPATERLL